MNWMSVLGLVLLVLGSVLSFLGGQQSDKKGQEDLTKEIRKKDETIDTLNNNVNLVTKKLSPFLEYAKELYPFDNDSVALKKLEERLNNQITERLNAQTNQIESNMSGFETASFELKELTERVSHFDRTALDKLIKIRDSEPNTSRGKYAMLFINQNAKEIVEYLRTAQANEGINYIDHYTNTYYKGIDASDNKKKLEIAVYEIETQNNLTEVAWGFLEIKKLGYQNIEMYEFDKVKEIKTNRK